MFWKNSWDKPMITIEYNDGRQPWKSWTFGRFSLVATDILCYLITLKYLIKWLL